MSDVDEVRDNLKAVSAYIFEDGAPDFMFEAVETAIRLLVGWQDIKTAPKDDTRILLFCDRAVGAVFTGKWFSKQNDVDGVPAYLIEGWWLDGFDHPFNQPPFMPTHWMPLPKPPTETKP